LNSPSAKKSDFPYLGTPTLPNEDVPRPPETAHPILPFPAVSAPRLQVRFLMPSDIPALLALEHKKWESNQAATALDMLDRMERYPHLSFGAFDETSGEALASLFLKPTSLEALLQSANWQECVAAQPKEKKAKDLFGISFSSTTPEAGEAVLKFLLPHALKNGYRFLYLGSPLPGFRRWLAKHPDGSVYRYAYSLGKKKKRKREGLDALPRDPQLCYYHQRGLRKIVHVRPHYFPHEESLDHGALIRGRLPLSRANFLWKRMPLSWLMALQDFLFFIVRR
jgi:hypothetical protein